MKKTFLLMAFFLVCHSFSLMAQYYVAGTNYTFRSSKPNYTFGSSKLNSTTTTSVLTVNFNSSGVATITHTEVPSTTGDQQTLHVFAPSNEISTTTDSDGGGMVETSGNLTKYWVIPFDNPTITQLGGPITVACDRMSGIGNCSVSFMSSGNTLNATIGADSSCQTCTLNVKNGRAAFVEGGSLLIKAESINLQ
jgi:hypothetical protein